LRRVETVKDADVLVVEVDVDVAVQLALGPEELLLGVRVLVRQGAQDLADRRAVGAHLRGATGLRPEDRRDLHRCHGRETYRAQNSS
jgi:hypothetical protein